MRPLVWPASVGSHVAEKSFVSISLQRQLRSCEPGEHTGSESSSGPSETPAGGADRACGISRLLCKAVLAGGDDVSKSICYQPWRRQRELSPARAREEREGTRSVCLRAFVPPAFCHSSPVPPFAGTNL